MSVTPENSRRIANLSFACACCVVLIHEPWPSDCWGLRGVIAATAVQYFYVVAGYLLASHFSEPDWWRRAVSKRVRSLLVPYALWMAITAAVLWLLTGDRPIGLGNSGLDLRKVPLLVPLWFVRGLFLFVLACPLVRRGLERWGRWFLLVEFLAAGFVSVMLTHGRWTADDGWGGLLVYGFPIEGLFYFSVGLWLRAHPVARSDFRYKSCALSLALVTLALRFSAGVGLFHPPFDLTFVTVPFCLLALWCAMPAVRWPKALVGNSFPVYVMHAVILAFIWNVPALRTRCPFWISVACGIIVPIIAATILKRFSPRLAAALFGGRMR